MSRVFFLEERCKGCLLCTTVCPKNIIIKASRYNAQGYEVVELSDASLCIGCASCGLICPDVAVRVFKTSAEKEGA